jgi:hypothetical protein
MINTRPMHSKENTIAKRFQLLIILITISVFSTAQKRTAVHGYILDSINYSPIANAQVTNTNTNKSTTTNEKGMFSLPVGLNDVLFVTAADYHFDTLRYSILLRDTLVMYISSLAHVLPGVTVTAAGYTKYQSDSIRRLQEFNSNIGAPKQPVASNANSGAGVGINLDFLSKKEKNKKKAYKIFNEQEKQAYVNYRFSPEIVSDYTGLKGDALNQFMQLYTPDYDWLRQHTEDEDIFYYLNDKLKSFYRRERE